MAPSIARVSMDGSEYLDGWLRVSDGSEYPPSIRLFGVSFFGSSQRIWGFTLDTTVPTIATYSRGART